MDRDDSRDDILWEDGLPDYNDYVEPQPWIVDDPDNPPLDLVEFILAARARRGREKRTTTAQRKREVYLAENDKLPREWKSRSKNARAMEIERRLVKKGFLKPLTKGSTKKRWQPIAAILPPKKK